MYKPKYDKVMTINKFTLNDPCISEHGPIKHCNQLFCELTFLNSWADLTGIFYYKSNETLVVSFD